jgi:hypothetical protein
MRIITCTCAFLLMFLSGCGSAPITIPGELEYREIPEALLQECPLPAAPLSNAEMSDAFAQAYKCGERGNKDKQRIRNLPRN